MPFDSAPTPSSLSATNHSSGLIIRRSLQLVESRKYTKLGAYSTNARTIKLKIVQRHSAGCYTVVRTVELSHPGGGWADVSIDSFTVPAGEYFIGYWYDSGEIDFTPDAARSYVFPSPATEPDGEFSADETVGNCAAVRAFYGGEDSPTPTGYFDVAGVFRNYGAAGYALINDVDHEPQGATSVQAINGGSASGFVRLCYPAASKVISLLVGPDETFVKLGYAAGASVGLSYADIAFSLNGSPVSPDSVLHSSGNWWFIGRMKA